MCKYLHENFIRMKNELTSLLTAYEVKDIFNVDETGYFTTIYRIPLWYLKVVKKKDGELPET